MLIKKKTHCFGCNEGRLGFYVESRKGKPAYNIRECNRCDSKTITNLATGVVIFEQDGDSWVWGKK